MLFYNLKFLLKFRPNRIQQELKELISAQKHYLKVETNNKLIIIIIISILIL
jgi:hypothetical protein